MKRDDAELLALTRATRTARSLRAEGLRPAQADRLALEDARRSYGSSLTKVAVSRIRRQLRERRSWAT
jgi:hypothetical protein